MRDIKLDTTDTLAPPAVAAALDIAQRADGREGDFVFIVRGAIKAGNVTGLGWSWFWRPPSDSTPGVGDIPIKLPVGNSRAGPSV